MKVVLSSGQKSLCISDNQTALPKGPFLGATSGPFVPKSLPKGGPRRAVGCFVASSLRMGCPCPC